MKTVESRPIGVFDSGMGGLTVLSELAAALPTEDFIYVGDTARVPYGSRSERTVQRYSSEIADHLLRFNIKALVIACNTATSHAEVLLRSKLSIPVIGVIRPGVDALLSRKSRHAGVIGTRSTIKSDAYGKLIRSLDPSVRVSGRACPLLVPIVEEGWTDHPATSLIIREYLGDLVRDGVDSLVLGCTHYPVLKNAIHREFPDLTLIDSSIETALTVKKTLGELDLLKGGAGRGGLRILLTDVTEQMMNLEKLFLGLSDIRIEEVKIPEE
jgi:glutamate racemase